MIRVLHCVNNMHRAGLETMIMNYYREIDRNEIQFDFLMHRKNKSDYDDEIVKLGGKIYRAPRLYPWNYFLYFKYMKNFFIKHNEYYIVHSHIDSMSFFPLLAAKKAGIPIRIAHSHSDSIEKDYKYLLKALFKKLLPNVANKYLACSQTAGEYLFPNKKFIILPNAINTNDFSYNAEVRAKIRKQLHIENSYVVGHVGRMNNVKNHDYLIDVFKIIQSKNNNSVLLLIGDGENMGTIRKKIHKYSLENKVQLLGNRDDVNSIYQAMDVLIFPSKFEGFGIVPIEAQCSGLLCLLSDVIPNEVKISDNCFFLSIEDDPLVWADKALCNMDYQRKSILNNEYDIKKVADVLEKYYKELLTKLIN